MPASAVLQALAAGATRLAGRALAVAGIVGVISFALMRSLPGDAAYRIAAGRYGYDIVDTAAADKVRAELGLDNPWWQQLAAWLGDLARLDLGRSLVSGEPVVEELAHQLGHTVDLSLVAWCLALGLAAGLAQITLHRMRQVLAAPSVAFARTKGLPGTWVVLRHVLRNTAVPVTAYAGMQLVLLIEGVVVVESFFAWPGIGHALIHALIARDVPMVQGAALCMGLMFVLLSAGVDALCWLLDPRMRARG